MRARWGKVAIASGHMIDAPERKEPRFPQAKVETVRGQIMQQLECWQIGSGDLAICGGACGADLLFAEGCLRRGARIRLLLAQQVDEFVRDSVRPGGEDWVQRFHAVRENAEVEILPPSPSGESNENSIYARTNLWIIETAYTEAGEPGKVCALLVWDEKPAGDGPGGTADFQKQVHRLGGQVEIINPTKL